MKMRKEVFTVLAERLTDEQLKREVSIFVRETVDVYIDDKGVWPSFDQFLAFRIGINSIRYVTQGVDRREEMERFAIACFEEAKKCDWS